MILVTLSRCDSSIFSNVDYIHRIGRTGRAGATGTAISFFTQAQSKLASHLVEILTEAEQSVPPQLQEMARFGGGGRGGGGGARYGGGGGGYSGSRGGGGGGGQRYRPY